MASSTRVAHNVGVVKVCVSMTLDNIIDAPINRQLNVEKTCTYLFLLQPIPKFQVPIYHLAMQDLCVSCTSVEKPVRVGTLTTSTRSYMCLSRKQNGKNVYFPIHDL